MQKTRNFKAIGTDGEVYWVDVWCSLIRAPDGSTLKGPQSYKLSDGRELFNVNGKDDEWEIAGTNVCIRAAKT